MSDRDLSCAYEDNLAEWWEMHICAVDGEADRTRGLWWTLDRAGGASSLHRVRQTEAGLEDALRQCQDDAAAHGSAIWAYVCAYATPGDAVERFKAAGFQHTKRFDVFAHDLAKLAPVKRPKGMRIERLDTMERFSKSVPHPYIGPITTANRKRALQATGVLAKERPEDFMAYVLSVDDVPTSTVTVFRTGEMAGIYDVGTLEAARGRGYAGMLLKHVLYEAKTAGAASAGLIAVAKAKALYERVGFRSVGWLSFLYYSKTKAQARALKG
ncbi:MAG: GNAT family N-acetyltransferase [Alphaproteobacteria bacterium]|nr:GNAT family N-acetyltransferase [Alphaproteobacteria bacterium]